MYYVVDNAAEVSMSGNAFQVERIKISQNILVEHHRAPTHFHHVRITFDSWRNSTKYCSPVR